MNMVAFSLSQMGLFSAVALSAQTGSTAAIACAITALIWATTGALHASAIACKLYRSQSI